jgi:hypothetical protein
MGLTPCTFKFKGIEGSPALKEAEERLAVAMWKNINETVERIAIDKIADKVATAVCDKLERQLLNRLRDEIGVPRK